MCTKSNQRYKVKPIQQVFGVLQTVGDWGGCTVVSHEKTRCQAEETPKGEHYLTVTTVPTPPSLIFINM